ncbi:MAG: putative toxin-antitoxin system toxin component, PIN family [Candidatus Thermoplasmatota archaeon]|nr:putative toxin-antitoxin system toxin component, PIN family [Candidatus Thermoplasmatota archaeon]
MITVFIDTNVIISGMFFSGLEAKILDSRELKLVSTNICREETLEVVERKFEDLSSRSLEKVLDEVEEALMDIEVVEGYREKMGVSKRCVEGENDRKVLAAVLSYEPDYFVTGDGDFHNEEVEERVEIIESRELLEKVK